MTSPDFPSTFLFSYSCFILVAIILPSLLYSILFYCILLFLKLFQFYSVRPSALRLPLTVFHGSSRMWTIQEPNHPVVLTRLIWLRLLELTRSVGLVGIVCGDGTYDKPTLSTLYTVQSRTTQSPEYDYV